MTDYSSQAHFGDYDPRNFGWPKRVPDLVPLTFDGVNFGQCARQVHGLFVSLLTELVPLIPGGLHPGSCWAYSTTDDLPDGSWSFHRFGIAIDVNWNANVMGASNAPSGQYAIPHAAASALARKYGCEYGGDWSDPKDWMHFEVHLTPWIARTIKASAPTPTPPPDQEFTMDAAAQARFDALDAHLTKLDGEVAELRGYVRKIFTDSDGHQKGALTLDQIATHPVIVQLNTIAAQLAAALPAAPTPSSQPKTSASEPETVMVER